MTIDEIASMDAFTYVTMPEDGSREVTRPYCCDLLSAAMRSAPEGGVWCTIMNNNNTLAVASLADCACIILCDDVQPQPEVIEKATEQDICVMKTKLPIFEAALEVYNKIHGTEV
ncbi:MAG: hypothetical protein K6G01_06210 [Eubacterium sp.]|nr:hypothetical protein [Eubacterium sp.]